MFLKKIAIRDLLFCKVMGVFGRGQVAIALSADLWIHYLNFVKSTDEYKNNEEFIRDQYERAVTVCGCFLIQKKLAQPKRDVVTLYLKGS